MTSPADQIIGLYRRHAQAWIKRRGTDLAEQSWLDAFTSHLPIGAQVLDLGCGSGTPFGPYLTAQGIAVTGVDASPELIAHAQRQIPTGTWITADMRGLDLRTKFQGILAWHSTFHLTPKDQRAMFPVFQRHATRQAVLMFTTGPQRGETLGTFEGEPLYHASLDPKEYRDLLDQHGFDVLRHVTKDPTCGHATIWLARKR